MIGTLTRANAAYFEGYGLRLFLNMSFESQTRLYAFRLPTATDPSPPGWASIARLARGQITEAVIDAWVGDQNTYVDQLALDLSNVYAGQRFFVTEHEASPTADLVHLDTEVAAGKRLVTSSPSTAPVPSQYLYPTVVRHEQLSPTDPSQLVIEFGQEHAVRIRVPDAMDQSPSSWWFVETFTGIAHERVVQGWHKGTNPVLEDAVRLLGEAIQGHAAPLTSHGIDLETWRRYLVRVRLAQGIKPFVFLGRPDYNTDRTRALFTDALGEYLFRTHVEPGESRGTPSLISDVDGKVTLQHLVDVDVMRGVLNRCIRFAAAGRPPKPRNPPKELIADLATFPERTWPTLKGIVRIPTVREDGSIITAPGYDAATRLWYAPEFELEPVPERPTEDEVAAAKGLLTTPFLEFPFLHEGGLAGTLAALLEQVVRPMIRGPRPLYIFDAPETGQGSGKCVSISSLCVTSRGLLSLAELAPLELPPDTAYQYSDDAFKVLTIDGSMPVSYYYSGGTKPTRKLRTQRGFELEGTRVHPVRVAGDGVVWKKLADVQVGDRVALCFTPHPGGERDLIDERTAEAYGRDALAAIPRTVRKSTARIWRAFVRGLAVHAHVIEGAWTWATTDTQLCRDVQILLAALGVGSVRTSTGLTVVEYDRALKIVLGLATPAMVEDHRTLTLIDPTTVVFDQVMSIEESEAEVADLSVPNGHSFVANGFQVHNTLLAKTIQAVVAGYDEPFISAIGKREEEIEKRITTLLKQQHPVLICDNLTGSVTSESLQQLATSERWQARLLNTNDAPIYPQTATWILTLNAARMNRDIARRAVLVQLDAKRDRAYERAGFRIEDLYTWARDRRASIIRAALILVRSWIAAGSPRDPEVVRGSFESWCKIIGGLLKHAGFPGLIRALEATNERDALLEDHRLFLHLWAREHNGVGQSLPASVLGEMAAHAGLYADRLRKGSGRLALGREMARLLRQYILGRTWDGYRVERADTLQNGYTTYTLIDTSHPPTPHHDA